MRRYQPSNIRDVVCSGRGRGFCLDIGTCDSFVKAGDARQVTVTLGSASATRSTGPSDLLSPLLGATSLGGLLVGNTDESSEHGDGR